MLFFSLFKTHKLIVYIYNTNEKFFQGLKTLKTKTQKVLYLLYYSDLKCFIKFYINCIFLFNFKIGD